MSSGIGLSPLQTLDRLGYDPETLPVSRLMSSAASNNATTEHAVSVAAVTRWETREDPASMTIDPASGASLTSDHHQYQILI